jgi:hypothetical protein
MKFLIFLRNQTKLVNVDFSSSPDTQTVTSVLKIYRREGKGRPLLTRGKLTSQLPTTIEN